VLPVGWIPFLSLWSFGVFVVQVFGEFITGLRAALAPKRRSTSVLWHAA